MKVVIANYTGDRGNWGCQATSRNLLGFLQRSFSHDPNLLIHTIPFPHGHEVDSLFDCVYGSRVKSIFSSRQPDAKDLKFLEDLTHERFGSAFDTARQADIIVFQGEGNVGPSVHYRTPNLFAIPFLASHLWQKPVLSLNQTIFANHPEENV